jgi:hypothetical protein
MGQVNKDYGKDCCGNCEHYEACSMLYLVKTTQACRFPETKFKLKRQLNKQPTERKKTFTHEEIFGEGRGKR